MNNIKYFVLERDYPSYTGIVCGEYIPTKLEIDAEKISENPFRDMGTLHLAGDAKPEFFTDKISCRSHKLFDTLEKAIIYEKDFLGERIKELGLLLSLYNKRLKEIENDNNI